MLARMLVVGGFAGVSSGWSMGQTAMGWEYPGTGYGAVAMLLGIAGSSRLQIPTQNTGRYVATVLLPERK